VEHFRGTLKKIKKRLKKGCFASPLWYNVCMMKIEINQWYRFDGDSVKVVEVLSNGNVVVESEQVGEEEVNPSKLQQL